MRRHQPRSRSRHQHRPPGPVLRGLGPALWLLLLCCSCGSADVSETERPPPKAATAVDPAGDSDEDGLTDSVEAKLGTSAFLADTDGDGYDDGKEIELNPNLLDDPYQFNPLIADVPRLAVEFVSPPKVYITHTDSRGKETRLESGTSDESSLRSSNSSSLSESLNWEVSVTAGFATKVGVLDGGVSYNASITGSVGGEKTSTWSQEVARENRKTLSESQALSESSETVSSGAEVEMTINIRNAGHLAFTIETLGLNVVKLPVDGGRPIGIGRLAPKGGSGSFFSQGTLRPGEGLEAVVCDISDINLGKAEELLKEGAFQVRSSQFELVDRDGRPFDHRFTEIAARTASISVDYGPEVPSEEFLVAIPMANGKGRALGQLMKDVLRMDYRTGTVVWNYPDGIRASGDGLVALGRYAADSKLAAYWIVSVIGKERGRDVQRTYNLLEEGFDFDGLEIKPRDQVHLVYISDADLDGLGDRLELVHGTDPRLADTDGDGTKDGEELRLGRNPLVDDRIPLPVVSEPSLEVFDRTVALAAKLENAGGEPGFGLWIDWGDGGPAEWVAADRSAIEVSHLYEAYRRFGIVVTPAGPHERRGKSQRLQVQVKQGWRPAWSRPVEDPLGHVVAASDGIYVASASSIARYSPDGSRRWLERPDVLRSSRFLLSDFCPSVRPGGGVVVAAVDGNAETSRIFRLDHQGHVVQSGPGRSGKIGFVSEDSAGNLYAAVQFRGASGARSHQRHVQRFPPGPVLMKLDQAEKTLWEITLQSTRGEKLSDIAGLAVLPDGSVYLAAHAEGKGRGAVVFRLAPDSKEIWRRSIFSGTYDFVIGVNPADAGGVYVSGFTIGRLADHEPQGEHDLFVRKYDSAGQIVWTRQMGTEDFDTPYGAASDARGNLHLVGETRGILGQGADPDRGKRKYQGFVATWSAKGQVAYLEHFLDEEYSTVNDVSVDADGSLYLALRIRKSLEPTIRETQGTATSALVKLEAVP